MGLVFGLDGHTRISQGGFLPGTDSVPDRARTGQTSKESEIGRQIAQVQSKKIIRQCRGKNGTEQELLENDDWVGFKIIERKEKKIA